MSPLKDLTKNGNLSALAFDCLGLMGIFIILGTTYFFEQWAGLEFWLFLFSGAIVGYFGAYGGLARKFGLNPFSNDPAGWRKAKESYKTQDEEKPGSD